jgi:hypothetical protein
MSRILCLTSILVLSACGLDPHAGYKPARDGAPPFEQANARCWERSMSLLGGLGMDAPRERAYDSCMRENGWADPRRKPEPAPATTPASSGR